MSFRLIAIIQAGCIFSYQTVITTSTAMMGLNCHPITDGKFINPFAERDYASRPFVARSKLPEGRCLWKMSRENFEVGATGTAECHFYQYLSCLGCRHPTFHNPYVLRAKKNCGAHCVRNSSAVLRCCLRCNHISHHFSKEVSLRGATDGALCTSWPQ